MFTGKELNPLGLGLELGLNWGFMGRGRPEGGYKRCNSRLSRTLQGAWLTCNITFTLQVTICLPVSTCGLGFPGGDRGGQAGTWAASSHDVDGNIDKGDRNCTERNGYIHGSFPNEDVKMMRDKEGEGGVDGC